MRIRQLGPAPQAVALYDEILAPSFRPEELCGRDGFVRMTEAGGELFWVAEDDDGRVLGAAIGEWDLEPRVVLLAWLAVRPGHRGTGVGGPLLDAAMRAWRQAYAPCLILAEVEDPAHHHGSELLGDPAARLRFYRDRGARALDLPYFQAALGPTGTRVPDLLLLVLHADPELTGTAPDTIDPAVLRRYFEIYQQQCEGKIGTDEQAMRLYDAVAAHPDGVPYRDW